MKEENKLIYPNFPENLIKSQLHLNQYIKFIDSRPIREKEKFKTSNHHKIPKALGGSNDKENMIHLTRREHFIAHLILWKVFGRSMALAFHLMRKGNKYQQNQYYKLTSRQFEQLRIEKIKYVANSNKNSKRSEKSKLKMSKAQKGNQNAKDHIHSKETRLKISKSNKGRKAWNKGIPATEEQKIKQSKTMKKKTPRKGWHHTEEAKLKMSKKKKGHIPWNKGLSEKKNK